jgi:hypothetical protein
MGTYQLQQRECTDCADISLIASNSFELNVVDKLCPDGFIVYDTPDNQPVDVNPLELITELSELAVEE